MSHGPVSSIKSGHFEKQMDRMAANWPNSDPQVVVMREREYRREYERVGNTRFEAGVTAALRGHSTGFHPTLAEFLEFVPSFAGAFERPTCPLCCRTGGLVYGQYSTHNGDRVWGMTKCLHGAEITNQYQDYQERRVGE